MTRRICRLAIAIAIGVFWSNAATAQSSKDYAMMGKMAWDAFGCSSLASVAEDAKEQSRLLTFGYEQGKKFLHALAANKIDQSDRSKIVPWGFLAVAQGPTTDFILGRAFEFAQNDALENIFGADGKLHTKERQKDIAKDRQQKRNCAIIGRGR